MAEQRRWRCRRRRRRECDERWCWQRMIGTGRMMRWLLLPFLCRLPLCDSWQQNYYRTPSGPLPTATSRLFRTRPRYYAREQVDDDDDDDDDDEEPPDVNIADFQAPTSLSSFGFGRGRSSPSQRLAMGRSKTGTTTVHVCVQCGAEYVQWRGQCPTCKGWNTLQPHVVQRSRDSMSRPSFGNSGRGRLRHDDDDGDSWLAGTLGGQASRPVRLSDVVGNEQTAASCGGRQHRLVVPHDDELNQVLGGGIMPGSLVLLGGDPGVGKSTLLLQVAGAVASQVPPPVGIGMGRPLSSPENNSMLGPVWYISGEESVAQIASRAARLGLADCDALWLLSETHVDTLCEQVVQHIGPASVAMNNVDAIGTAGDGGVLLDTRPPSLLVVDSIQTLLCDAGGTASAGGVTQVRECVALLLRLAKSTNIPILLVGHVTKTGDVAGPRTVEHMVDAVLYLQGSGDDHTINLRVLRASKNRFGSTDHVGIYEMTTGRLLPVSDPSSMLMANRVTEDDSEGCAVAVMLEGLRPLTIDIQALVTLAGGMSGFGRRTTQGIPSSRLLLLMGVLQKRCGMYMSRQDVYVNVAGRLKLDQKNGEGNASDLAVVMALVSSLVAIPVRADTAFVGEVGLLGELRSVPGLEKRLQEARRMGFSRIVTPRQGSKYRGTKKEKKKHNVVTAQSDGVEWIQCSDLLDAIGLGLTQPLPKRSQRKRASASPQNVDELGLDEIVDDCDEENFL